jgi:TetR/AcrR family transcriptional regulator, regulator of mycofactocin system
LTGASVLARGDDLPAPPRSVLARKRDVVRDGLARVAIDLFARDGFEAVTVEEIARAAGISPRTFFRYFPSKDEIVLALASRLHDRLLTAFEERPEHEGAVEALRRAYIVTSTVTPADRDRVLRVGRILTCSPALRSGSYGRPWRDGAPIVERVAERMDARPPDPRPRIIVAAMAAVATTEWHAWVDDGGTGDPAERIDAALETLEGGLGALETRAPSGRQGPARKGRP